MTRHMRRICSLRLGLHRRLFVAFLVRVTLLSVLCFSYCFLAPFHPLVSRYTLITDSCSNAQVLFLFKSTAQRLPSFFFFFLFLFFLFFFLFFLFFYFLFFLFFLFLF